MAHIRDIEDDMVQCPYNVAHRMMRKRLQPHLARCRLSYPDVELIKCPFNAGHLVPEPEYRHHASTCPDRASVTSYKYNVRVEKPDVKITPQDQVQCDDDWDDVQAESYNPQKYASESQIIRGSNNTGVPSERKMFREMERRRHGEMDLCDDDE